MQWNNIKHQSWFKFLVNFMGILVIIPLTPFVCRFIPPLLVGNFNFDFILALVISILVVRFFIWILRPFIIPFFILIGAFLVYKQVNGTYTVKTILQDYKNLTVQNWYVKEQKEADLLNKSPHLFENIQSRTARIVKSKISTTDPVVRNFALKHSLEYFADYKAKYGPLVRYFSLFKYINNNFKYVPDPLRDEYYATAKETIQNGLGGDCDDHSILMASCMESIGAKCRLVVVEGHMYPELYIGDKKDFLIAQQAIIQLFSNYRIQGIFYHENNGEYWINLDYTARYPGGPYMNDNVKLVIDI
ncbi:transglutaminase domain-containing protein [Rhizosphaericola mali]|uniref:Transglutaminase domain-containing protein n=2 Tax=Rhizosphaericola mali TaxID=2545455 RepID=A0A5P2G3I2_9BACT|nr:transglutaminase domain-containing protein [Rhizosphaericola mali]